MTLTLINNNHYKEISYERADYLSLMVELSYEAQLVDTSL